MSEGGKRRFPLQRCEICNKPVPVDDHTAKMIKHKLGFDDDDWCPNSGKYISGLLPPEPEPGSLGNRPSLPVPPPSGTLADEHIARVQGLIAQIERISFFLQTAENTGNSVMRTMDTVLTGSSSEYAFIPRELLTNVISKINEELKVQLAQAIEALKSYAQIP